MKAAVLRAYKTPVEIEDLEVADPGPREVRVRTRACGVCHSDLHVFEGSLPGRLVAELPKRLCATVKTC